MQLEEWTKRAKDHAALVGPLGDAFLKRRKAGLTHAVHDFLFIYYTCTPTKLKQWVPSIEQQLVVTPEILKEYFWLNDYWFQVEGNLLSLKKKAVPSALFVRDLCENILKQPPRFGCFGLHEWAMVYRTQEVRHSGHRLRLPSQELDRFVESQTMCCSHYDAYRFFTEEAKPLNMFSPRLDTRLEMEQGGCLHANMDIYKWAIKLWPWIGSDFLAKAFFLAVEGRELDMCASPYDLKSLGYIPICIETEEGRKEYQRKQMHYAEKATVLRQELLAFCTLLTTK